MALPQSSEFAAHIPAPSAPLDRPPILVADDRPEIHVILRRCLNSVGYQTVHACSGREALHRLAEQEFGLLMADIVMPDIDGLELIMQARKAFPRLPVLAMSGGGKYMAAPACTKLAKHLGAHAVLPKPFGQEELLEMVEALISPKSAAQATEPAAPSERGGPRILVVNDDENSLFLIRETILLALPACQILEERSSLTALAVLAQRPVDLVITDNSMPQMSGLEMVAKIRITNARLPVVLVTSSDHLEPQAKAAGVTRFLSSADVDKIPETIAALLTHG